MRSWRTLAPGTIVALLTWGSVAAQDPGPSAWTAVLTDLTRTGRGVWLGGRMLRGGEFWTAGGSALDTAWTRGLKERGLILGRCELATCPTTASTTVALLEAPRPANEVQVSVRVVLLMRLRAACGDSVRSDVLDMESFTYTLARRDSAWVVTGKQMGDAGHARDSAAVLQVGPCGSRG